MESVLRATDGKEPVIECQSIESAMSLARKGMGTMFVPSYNRDYGSSDQNRVFISSTTLRDTLASKVQQYAKYPCSTERSNFLHKQKEASFSALRKWQGQARQGKIDKKVRKAEVWHMNLTERFLSSIEGVAEKDISTNALERAKKALLDYIAVTIAGAKANEAKLTNYFKEVRPEPGNSTIIGMDKKTNLKEAVFLNGLNAHALDLDDGTNAGIIHLGSPIFSVLIPLAEKYHISLDKMLRAAVIGYETSFTMAVSIQPRHKVMGYHATGTCGVLGIAVAVAYMLDFSPSELRNAFAIAAVSATGMLKVLDDGWAHPISKSALLGLHSNG